MDLKAFGARVRTDKDFAMKVMQVKSMEEFMAFVKENGYTFTEEDVMFGARLSGDEMQSLLNFKDLMGDAVAAAAQDTLTVGKKDEGDKITFTLEGRLCTSTQKHMEDTLLPVFETAKEVVLDLSKLTYLSSMGLRVLLVSQKTANVKGVSMTICNVSDEIMEVMKMTGFADILTFA